MSCSWFASQLGFDAGSGLGYKNHKLFFYSNEGNRLEPLHINVRKGESVAKF